MSYVQLALGSSAARSSSRGAPQGSGGSRISRPSSSGGQKTAGPQVVTEKPALAQAPIVAPSSPASPEVSYAQLASNNRAVRGQSRGLQRPQGGSRAARLSSQTSADSFGHAAAEAPGLSAGAPLGPMQPSAQTEEMSYRSHWEEFVVHRHETRLKLETLMEAREQQKIAEARGRLEVEQLDDKFEMCVEELQEVCKQFCAFEERLASTECGLGSEHRELEAVRQRLQDYSRELKDGFSRLDLSLHTQHEAVVMAIKRGDRGVADELLLKMSELNEKLGRNMQALEDEVARDLQGMAFRMEKFRAVHDAAPDFDTVRANALQAVARAQDTVKLDVKEAVKCMQEEMLRGFDKARATHEDLTASLKGSLDDMHEELTAQLTKAKDEVSSSLREELCTRLEEVHSAREALAAAVEESLRDTREELCSKIASHATPSEIPSLVNEALSSVQDSLGQVREDLRNGLGEAQQARREIAASAESAAQGVDGIRTELHAGLDEVRGMCTSLASAADKAVCGARRELDEQIASLHVECTSKASRVELASSVDKALSDIRSELVQGIDSACETQGGTARACEELQRELELVRNGHGSWKAEVDSTLTDIQADLAAGRAAALTREELTAALDSAVQGLRREWHAELEDALKGDASWSSSGRAALDAAVQDLRREWHVDLEEALKRDGSCSERAVKARNCSQEPCFDCRDLFEDVRAEAGAATEKLQQRMQDFHEEMLEMMENHEQQACGGCVEVQQGLEAAAVRVAGLEDEFQRRCAELDEEHRHLQALEQEMTHACDGIRGDTARLERDLGEHGSRLETFSGVIGRIRAQLDMLEPRLDAVSRAAHNTSSTSSPIRLERHLEASVCELLTSPTTLSEAHGHIATLEERLEALELAAREKSLETVQDQEQAKGSQKCEDSPPTALAGMQTKLDSLEEQLNVLQQGDLACKSHVEQSFETQKVELAAAHRAIAELTNDVLKAQGGADAAYAEATRQQDCTSAIQTAMDAIRCEWKAEFARSTTETRDSIATTIADQSALAVQGVRDTMCARWESHLQEELADVARVQAQSEERHRCEFEQLRAEVQSLISELNEQKPRHSEVVDAHDVPDKMQTRYEVLIQQKLEEFARRCELEQLQAEVREEVERVLEAMEGQTAGITERCETLTLETQRQCRTWVDGALRKLEELALRTKERLSAFASERRALAADHEGAVRAAASKAAIEAAQAAAADVTATLEKRLGAEIRRLLAAERHLMAERLLAPEDAEQQKGCAPHTGSTLASSSSPHYEASCRQTPSAESSSPLSRPQAVWPGEPDSFGRSPLSASPTSPSKASPKLRQPVFVQPASALLHTPPAEAKSRPASSGAGRQTAAEEMQSDHATEESPAPRARVAPLAAG